jgi:hypothetical protein
MIELLTQTSEVRNFITELQQLLDKYGFTLTTTNDIYQKEKLFVVRNGEKIQINKEN